MIQKNICKHGGEKERCNACADNFFTVFIITLCGFVALLALSVFNAASFVPDSIRQVSFLFFFFGF